MSNDEVEDGFRRQGFGMRLKAARERVQLTQQQVADRFGVKKGTVSAWETGGGLPDALRLARLAKLYDVSADALLWDDSLSPEAMQFAADFDSLTEDQRKTLKAVWMAFVQTSASDSRVEGSMPITRGTRQASAKKQEQSSIHPAESHRED